MRPNYRHNNSFGPVASVNILTGILDDIGIVGEYTVAEAGVVLKLDVGEIDHAIKTFRQALLHGEVVKAEADNDELDRLHKIITEQNDVLKHFGLDTVDPE